MEHANVTAAFRKTVEGLGEAWIEHEEALRDQEGDERYEDSLEVLQKMLEGIDEGLILRSWTVVESP